MINFWKEEVFFAFFPFLTLCQAFIFDLSNLVFSDSQAISSFGNFLFFPFLLSRSFLNFLLSPIFSLIWIRDFWNVWDVLDFLQWQSDCGPGGVDLGQGKSIISKYWEYLLQNPLITLCPEFFVFSSVTGYNQNKSSHQFSQGFCFASKTHTHTPTCMRARENI